MIQLTPTDPAAWSAVIRTLQTNNAAERQHIYYSAMEDVAPDDRIDFMLSTYGAYVAVIAAIVDELPIARVILDALDPDQPYRGENHE